MFKSLIDNTSNCCTDTLMVVANREKTPPNASTCFIENPEANKGARLPGNTLALGNANKPFITKAELYCYLLTGFKREPYQAVSGGIAAFCVLPRKLQQDDAQR
jgi:hypothetical protein